MSGSINFKIYPTTNRVPGVFAEVDASNANTGQAQLRTLIIGQMLTGGQATAGIPRISAGVGDAITQYGNGSQAALMVARYRQLDAFGELWVLPLADDGAAVAQTVLLTFSGPATASGTLPLYVCGVAVPVAVTAGDTAAVIATNVAAAVNVALMAIPSLAGGQTPLLPVTAAAASGVVTFTARNKGAAADIDVRLAYYGAVGGEVVPAGVTATVSAGVTGTGNPSSGLATALANLPTIPFDFIALPFTDATSLNSIGSFLNDQTGRWSWLQELFGHAFAAIRGTFSAITTFGVTRNDQHVSIIGFNDSPSPAWWWAAELAAVTAVSARADPALPVTQVALQVLAPPVQSRFSISNRNSMLYDGISTFIVDDSGTVQIERVVTTYQTTAGVPDNSYLDVETMNTLAFVIRSFRTFFATRYARKKLVSDGNRIAVGSNLVTPGLIRAASIARYQLLATAGLVQNTDQFAQGARAENAGNGQVSLYLPVQLANQLRQIVMLVAFSKP